MNYEDFIREARNYQLDNTKEDKDKQSRALFIERWPEANLINMTVEDYCGLEKDSFCYWLEFKKLLGGAGGGSSFKFGIYKNKVEGVYIIRDGMSKKELNFDEAQLEFEKIKNVIIKTIKLAKERKIEELESLETNLASMIQLKIISIYFKDIVFTLYSKKVLEEVAKTLNILTDEQIKKYSCVSLNYYINKNLDTLAETSSWSDTKRGTFLWEKYFDILGVGANLSKTTAKAVIGLYLSKFSDYAQEVRFQNKPWNEIYKLFYQKLGADKPTESFCNGLKNNRDSFDGYFNNSRQGWKESSGAPIELTGAKEDVYQKYKDFDEEILWKVISQYLDSSPAIEITEEIMKTSETISKNTILFGPPGTGKTYNSINKAVSIANPDFDLSQNREAIKAEYDRLVEEGQIVFTTFHQSMSYEDFIEGIKPVEPKNEGDPVNYKVQPGIFKRLCDEASFSSGRKEEVDIAEDELEFSDRYDAFVEGAKIQLAGGTNPELESRNGGSVIIDKVSDLDNIIIKHHDGTRSYTVSKYRLTKLHAAFSDLNTITNINRQFQDVIGGSNSSAYWSVLNAVSKIKIKKPITLNNDKKVSSAKNFVLIIDEINRGNVSQIFGELITLVEDNKRLGSDEALKLVLPYSKLPFGVPNNVYIIGTMNTADRSVEALDTALRRRFSFEEMSPDSSKLNKISFGSTEIDQKLILDKINKRIEKLLNKDHLIGHSFFLNVKNIADLKAAFGNKIIPLLQEYFYGDFGKIGLVLGAGFIKLENSVQNKIFAKFEGYEVDDLSAKPIYTLADIGSMDDQKFKAALDGIIKE